MIFETATTTWTIHPLIGGGAILAGLGLAVRFITTAVIQYLTYKGGSVQVRLDSGGANGSSTRVSFETLIATLERVELALKDVRDNLIENRIRTMDVAETLHSTKALLIRLNEEKK